MTFKQDVFAVFECLCNVLVGVANIWCNLFSVLNTGSKKLILVKKRFVVNMLKSEVLECADVFELCLESFVIKKLVNLNTDF